MNDYTTLVIGMVINQVPFNQILSIDRLYVRSGAPLPTASSNAHYEALETRMMEPEFDPMAELVDVPESTVYPMLPPQATAGAMTTRAVPCRHGSARAGLRLLQRGCSSVSG